jgi:hypothetical protein
LRAEWIKSTERPESKKSDGVSGTTDGEVPDRHEARGFRDYALVLFLYNTKTFW